MILKEPPRYNPHTVKSTNLRFIDQFLLMYIYTCIPLLVYPLFWFLLLRINFAYFGASYKWNHTELTLLNSTSFPQNTIFKIDLCYCIYQYLFLLVCNTTTLDGYTKICLSILLWMATWIVSNLGRWRLLWIKLL